MGASTNYRIAVFREKAGISVPPATTIELWRELQALAFETIRVAELEKSGIRDGDSFWHGSDVVGGTLRDLENVIARLRAAYTIDVAEPPQAFADSIHW
jgi:hypothetical protein